MKVSFLVQRRVNNRIRRDHFSMTLCSLSLKKHENRQFFVLQISNTCDDIPYIPYCRDAEVFPDPEKFDPKRFLDEHGKFHRADHVVSYGIGKWISLGLAFQLARIMIGFFSVVFLDVCPII